MRAMLGSAALMVSLSTCAGGAVATVRAPVVPEVGERVVVVDSGRLVVSYPSSWFADGHPEGPAAITNFRLGTRCCALRDGDVKIDVLSDPADGALLEEHLDLRCRPGAASAPVSCEMVEIHGRTWAWIRALDGAEGASVSLTAMTVSGDRLYTVAAIVPAGPSQHSGLSRARAILRGIRAA